MSVVILVWGPQSWLVPVQASLRDAEVRACDPGIEMPGYFRASLREL